MSSASSTSKRRAVPSSVYCIKWCWFCDALELCSTTEVDSMEAVKADRINPYELKPQSLLWGAATQAAPHGRCGLGAYGQLERIQECGFNGRNRFINQ